MPSLKNLLQKINTHSKNLSKLSSNNIVKLVDKDIFKLSDSQIYDLIDIIEDREKFEGLTKDVRKDLIERLNDIIEIKKVLGGIRGTNTLTPAEIRKKRENALGHYPVHHELLSVGGSRNKSKRLRNNRLRTRKNLHRK